MALTVENVSNGKIIGIGPVTVLPGETKEIPAEYANNPALNFYREKGFVRVSGSVETPAPAKPSGLTAEEEREKAEATRKARLASLKGISEEDLGRLAGELNINPADCKDYADMLKRVKAALKA